ncbi:hypothetical protein OPV22_031181 [Ensete ventricosum]|uniref:Uncharacterized protein n=1 Tax=Ensete ventricosum TaxID=4639 RepID=A0AAV8PLP6_ENSVE|nr:hypothetical protein OPV22_031181 [Ensete ventricosum]
MGARWKDLRFSAGFAAQGDESFDGDWTSSSTTSSLPLSGAPRLWCQRLVTSLSSSSLIQLPVSLSPSLLWLWGSCLFCLHCPCHPPCLAVLLLCGTGLSACGHHQIDPDVKDTGLQRRVGRRVCKLLGLLVQSPRHRSSPMCTRHEIQ